MSITLNIIIIGIAYFLYNVSRTSNKVHLGEAEEKQEKKLLNIYYFLIIIMVFVILALGFCLFVFSVHG